MPEDKGSLDTEYFQERWQEPQMGKGRDEGKTRLKDMPSKGHSLQNCKH